MKKQLVTTQEIREANELVITLQNALPQMMGQPFWKPRLPMQEKIEFLKVLAQFRCNLWEACQTAYPELIGKAYSVNNAYVSYEEVALTPPPNKLKE